MKRILIIEFICYLLIVLFLYAAFSKLLHYQTFVLQMSKSLLLAPFSKHLAWIIPIAEMIIAACLIIPSLKRLGLYAAFTLMCLFTFYILAIFTFSSAIPCSCGGILGTMGWHTHLIFNICIVIVIAFGIIISSDDQAQSAKPTPS